MASIFLALRASAARGESRNAGVGASSSKTGPTFIWRSTIAPCGFARCFDANPQTAADINSLIIEKLVDERAPDSTPFWSSFIDGYDLTFPFHFDNVHCDGGHYGKRGYSKYRKTNTTEDFVDHVSTSMHTGT